MSAPPSPAGPAPDPGRDNHVHTPLCNHAHGSMEDYVLAALERGLHTICFLEHLEEGIRYDHRIWLRPRDFDEYFREGERLRQRFADRIRILLGVECGWNAREAETLRRRIGDWPFDWVGLSCHFLEQQGAHVNLVSRREENLRILRGLDPAEVLDRYFAALEAAVETLPGRMLCHVDAALRHVPGVVPRDRHLEALERIFALMAARGMCLEINTSGYAYRGECFPAPHLIAMAQGHGLCFMAGSDAHRPEQVGRYFDRLPGLFRSA